jgi:hypothetical protein
MEEVEFTVIKFPQEIAISPAGVTVHVFLLQLCESWPHV